MRAIGHVLIVGYLTAFKQSLYESSPLIQDSKLTVSNVRDLLNLCKRKKTHAPIHAFSSCSMRQRKCFQDNLQWIRAAQKHKLVVGSQARILYSDHEGRIEIALAFNAAVRDGRLKVRLLAAASSLQPQYSGSRHHQPRSS